MRVQRFRPAATIVSLLALMAAGTATVAPGAAAQQRPHPAAELPPLPSTPPPPRTPAVPEGSFNYVPVPQEFAVGEPKDRPPSFDPARSRPVEEETTPTRRVWRNEDGTFSWKFDPYVRSFAPVRFRGDDVRSLWERITCPTLLVRGEQSWASDPVKDGRITPFRNARLLNVPKAGHWVHHDQLDVFLRETKKFLAD